MFCKSFPAKLGSKLSTEEGSLGYRALTERGLIMRLTSTGIKTNSLEKDLLRGEIKEFINNASD
ncbi:hypothetical protein EV03_0839 [Prochlorococcus marinus str. PAC1]|uniref:Uncharacterized protein n=1 Tax=Prochlorococcus marinus str. PAC1 TaxID=59924 RepID=A0A0A2C5U3_PROMR|nr:hypothetical protein EV03_0839 [Prochlorococcus marinus str. PAC1]